VSVAGVKAAGLIHDGFYKHFALKDDLIAEALAEPAVAPPVAPLSAEAVRQPLQTSCGDDEGLKTARPSRLPGGQVEGSAGDTACLYW
jgi:hypothetical protein